MEMTVIKFLVVVGLALGGLFSVRTVEAADCSKTSTGLTALTDGPGLYAGSANDMPTSWRGVGEAAAATVLPVNGKTGFISIGVSNARIYWEGKKGDGSTVTTGFQQRMMSDPAREPSTYLVNGAQGSMKLSTWAYTSTPWTALASKVTAGGLTASQVQAVWMQFGISDWYTVQQYVDALGAVMTRLQASYPNVKVVYISGINYVGYGGYAFGHQSEPYGYNANLAVKQFVDEYVTGARSGPFVAWGPYFWADGVNPNTQGLSWSCSNFYSDGVHPNRSGADKMIPRMISFFKSDSTSTPWLVSNGLL